jgi:hypothetical protein
MLSTQRLVRWQWVFLGLAVALLLVYATLFRWLARQAAALDKPLKESWKSLAEAAQKNDELAGGDMTSLLENVRLLERSLVTLQRTADEAVRRAEPDPATRDKLQEPFQLLDFDSSRIQMMTELRRLADSKKVTLEDAVYAGFPQYKSGLSRAPLLWAQLSLVNQVLTTAVMQQPRQVRSVALLPSRTHESRDTRQGTLEELPVRIEFVGSLEAMNHFFLSLPLRGAELKEMGCPEVPVPKPALFVEKFILKNTTNSPRELYLEAVVSGFVLLKS